MSGGDGFRDMERYGRKHEARLREFLELENGVPGHDTFRRVLSTLHPEAFGVCVRLWQRAAAPCARSRSCCCGATPSAAWASARCARSARGISRRRRGSFLGAKGRRRPHRESRITPFSHRPRSGWSANPGTCPQGDRRAGMAVRRKSRNPVPPLQGTFGSF